MHTTIAIVCVLIFAVSLLLLFHLSRRAARGFREFWTVIAFVVLCLTCFISLVVGLLAISPRPPDIP